MRPNFCHRKEQNVGGETEYEGNGDKAEKKQRESASDAVNWERKGTRFTSVTLTIRVKRGSE